MTPGAFDVGNFRHFADIYLWETVTQLPDNPNFTSLNPPGYPNTHQRHHHNTHTQTANEQSE